MSRAAKIGIIFVLTVLALVWAGYYSFWLGYGTAKEIWRRGGVITLQPAPPKPTNI